MLASVLLHGLWEPNHEHRIHESHKPCKSTDASIPRPKFSFPTAHHSVFILSTTLPRLNSSSVHLLGLSILNILQCYYLSFSLCVCVIFKDISSDKRSNILLFSGGYQSIIGGKSRGSMLSSAMAASNL